MNATLRAGVKRYRVARLVDWHALASHHPGWLWSDGIHLTHAGVAGYARAIGAAIH